MSKAERTSEDLEAKRLFSVPFSLRKVAKDGTVKWTEKRFGPAYAWEIADSVWRGEWVLTKPCVG